MQTIMDSHFAAALCHAIDDAAVAVVVIEILFIRPCHELVLTSAEEDRITHQVVDRTVRLLGVHRHFVALRTDRTELHFRFAVTLALDAVEDLRQAYHYGVVIDAVIYGVVGGGELLIAVRIGRQGIMDNNQRCVRQVESLSALAGGKERRVTRSCGLYHFVFRREQIHGVFTRPGVGLENDTFLLEEGVGHYLFSVDIRIGNLLLHRITRQIIGVVHELGGVVAFQLEHQLQVVTEVVLAQTEAVLQVTLVVTSGYAADETYLGLVVEPYTV